MPRKARTDATDKKAADAFITALREGLSISGACQAAKLNRTVAYNWRKADPEWAKEWDDAIEAGTDALEDEARRRGFRGVGEPVYYKGEVCGEIQRYSDTLLIFMLKGRRPDKFRENFKMEVSGTIDLANRVKRAGQKLTDG